MVSGTKRTPHARPQTSTRGRGFTLPLWVLGIIGVVFVAVALFAGVVLFRVVQDMVATGPFAAPTVPALVPSGGVEVPGEPGQAGDVSPVVDLETSNSPPIGIKPTDRVTVLLLGVDQECAFVEQPRRSDTLILLTIDPLSKTAGILSIPRDLWVPIPGFGNNRVNTAFTRGEISQYPGGGAALAVQTVELNLGIHIHHYVTVDFDGFVRAVDLIGGIEVDVPEAINDPDYPDRCYGYDPFYLPAGHQYLDGETALKYARTRATFGVDFDRAGRQQEVILAALEKVKDQNVALLARAPELWLTFQDSVTTDMTYQEAIGLGLLALEIKPESIYHAVIDYNYVQDYTAPDGARVLIPLRERIRDLRDAFLSANVQPVPQIDLATQMRNESAAILVLNGTWTPGLAGGTAEYLASLGFSIIGVDDAEDKNQTVTQIIDYAGKTATVNYLAETLHVSAGSIYGGTSRDGDYDIKVILGTDWSPPDS